MLMKTWTKNYVLLFFLLHFFHIQPDYSYTLHSTVYMLYFRGFLLFKIDAAFDSVYK
jgi:hypothetical protein